MLLILIKENLDLNLHLAETKKAYYSNQNREPSREEVQALLGVGFEYVTEKNGIMLFRRPKRLGATVG